MSGGHRVDMISGTSMAATGTPFDDVLIAGREEADLYNRAFVVSAHTGMTDLLVEHKKPGKPGVYACHFDAAARALHRALVEVAEQEGRRAA